VDVVWWYFLEFIVLVGLSGFFSGAESALFSLSEADVREIRERENESRALQRIIDLLHKPDKLLNTILIGNTLVNVAAAMSASLIMNHLLGGIVSELTIYILDIIIVTLILLIFSEVTPKVIAVKRALNFAAKVSLPLSFAVILFSPLTYIFGKLTAGAALMLKLRKDRSFIDEEEFKTLFEVGEENGTLKASEREMIHSIMEFRDTTVKEVMIPRMDIVSVEKDIPINDFLEIVKKEGHSRIPLYDDKVDNILGILHVKDILYYTGNMDEIPPLRSFVREAFFIPESMGISVLLKDFQRKHRHMAIVVDEYGGTAGLVTLEDVIEEIVGEIQDEYDIEAPLYKLVAENVWVVDAKISIEDLNEALSLNLPEEEGFESLGGLILKHLGHIPESDESFEYDMLVMTIETLENQRIEKVRIKLVELQQNDHPQNVDD